MHLDWSGLLPQEKQEERGETPRQFSWMVCGDVLRIINQAELEHGISMKNPLKIRLFRLPRWVGLQYCFDIKYACKHIIISL